MHRFVLFPLVFTLWLSPVEGSSQASKPNVVIFYTDDQKMDSFGFINGKAHTPHIDDLAKQGAYFSNAYATSSVCTPSRYSALTGKYASRNTADFFTQDTTSEGVTKVLWNTLIGLDEWTFPKVMQQNGYKTGMIGKWHVGLTGKYGYPQDVPNNNPADPATKAVLQANQELICKDIADRGFDYVGGAYSGNPNDSPNLIATCANVHAVEWQNQHALDFIEQYQDEPFILYYGTTLLHTPKPIESLENVDPKLTPEGLLDEPVTGGMPERENVIRRARAAGVSEPDLIAATWLDDVVGSVRAKLEELGLAENTMIIYFNDNSTDDQGKGSCYQGGAHVPMMVYHPRLVVPGERTELAANIDIAPTIFELCRVTPPADMPLDGLSLLPLLRGEKTEWRDHLYLEIGLTRAVVTENYKYLAFRVPQSYTNRPLEDRLAEHKEILNEIHQRHPWSKEQWQLDPEARYYQMGMFPGGGFMERLQIMYGNPPFKENYFDPDQLYDLEKDPRETTNLAQNPEYATKLKAMQAKLGESLAEVPGTYPELKSEE
ncbi:MAG: sulfatase-like hydrolase/transferase [Verrucomicrobiota bacterium]